MPQPQQRWIQATCSSVGSLAHWVRLGIKPASSRILCWVLNPLSHNGSSYFSSLEGNGSRVMLLQWLSEEVRLYHAEHNLHKMLNIKKFRFPSWFFELVIRSSKANYCFQTLWGADIIIAYPFYFGEEGIILMDVKNILLLTLTK